MSLIAPWRSAFEIFGWWLTLINSAWRAADMGKLESYKYRCDEGPQFMRRSRIETKWSNGPLPLCG